MASLEYPEVYAILSGIFTTSVKRLSLWGYVRSSSIFMTFEYYLLLLPYTAYLGVCS